MREVLADRLLVAATDASIEASNDLIELKLPDPCTGQERTYLLTDTGIAEVQKIGTDYGSFIVDSNVLKDGNLYTITPVDALYWFLAKTEEMPNISWQPLDQILSLTPLTEHIEQEQLIGHMLDSMDLSEDESFYKFSEKKALEWLRCKQARVQAVLERQYLRDLALQQKRSSGGAFADSFSMERHAADSPKSVLQEKEEAPVLDDATKTITFHESLQAVCHYLNDAWRDRFLEFLNETPQVLEPVKKKKSSSLPLDSSMSDWNANLVAGNGASNLSSGERELKKPQTVGAKRLAKVNTKGMKKMSSFFGAKKAKKN